MRREPRTALVVLALGLALAPEGAGAQSWRTVTRSRQLSGEEELRVHVTYGAGRLKVHPAEEGLLYRMRVRYDEDTFEPRADFDGRRLRLGVEGIGRSIRIGKRRSGEMELGLARDVPMELSLEFGAVRADLELGGLSLTGLDLQTGASESTVRISEPNPVAMDRARFRVGAADFTVRRLGNLNAERIEVDAGLGEVTLWFTGEWRHDTRVSVEMGLGSLELRFPEGLGVRLRKDSFLTGLDSEGLVKRGDSYYSLDWDEAGTRITVDLNAAFGSVRVVWVR